MGGESLYALEHCVKNMCNLCSFKSSERNPWNNSLGKTYFPKNLLWDWKVMELQDLRYFCQ